MTSPTSCRTRSPVTDTLQSWTSRSSGGCGCMWGPSVPRSAVSPPPVVDDLAAGRAALRATSEADDVTDPNGQTRSDCSDNLPPFGSPIPKRDANRRNGRHSA